MDGLKWRAIEICHFCLFLFILNGAVRAPALIAPFFLPERPPLLNKTQEERSSPGRGS